MSVFSQHTVPLRHQLTTNIPTILNKLFSSDGFLLRKPSANFVCTKLKTVFTLYFLGTLGNLVGVGLTPRQGCDLLWPPSHGNLLGESEVHLA